MKPLLRAASIALIFAAAVQVTLAETAEPVPLKDMSGTVVSVYKGSASVVSHVNGEPADGSQIARKIRPGAST